MRRGVRAQRKTRYYTPLPAVGRILIAQRQRGSTGWSASSEPQRFARFFFGPEYEQGPGDAMSDNVLKASDRRSFLRGSALFAAALGMSVVPGFAQEKPKPTPKPEESE